MKLSIAIATYNEQNNLARCLSSVSDMADEIVLVDGGSSDKTLEIAKTYHAKIIRTDNPPIFHINKQKALDGCRGDWILQLDADEVVPPDLAKEIVTIIKQQTTKNQQLNGYYIPRKNYFWGHFMKKGGQYPDYVIRLFRRGKGRFPAKSVHEQIAIEGEVGHLTNPMLHYSYMTRRDYWKKSDSYTTLTAREYQKEGVPKDAFHYIYYTVWKPLTTFVSIFVRHKGFMDGLTGFEFALYSGLHYATAYKKYVLGIKY